MELDYKKAGGFAIIIFAFLLLLNVLLPLVGDDYLYLNNSVGLANLTQYSIWNPRIYDILYLGFIVRLNPYIFDILNAILGTMFIVGLYVLLFWDFKRKFCLNDAIYLFLMLFLLCVACNFEGVFLWGAGSANYLWGGAGFILVTLHIKAFMLNVNRHILHKKSIIVLFLILNLLSAMSHEVLAVFMTISYIVLFVVFRKQYQFPLYYKISFLLCIVGLLYLLSATGSNVRAIAERERYDYLSLGEILALSFGDKLRRIYLVLSNFASKTPIILPTLLFIGYFFRIYKTPILYKKITLFSLSFVLFIVILWQIPLFGIIILVAMSVVSYYLNKDKLVILLLMWVFMGFTQIQFGKNFPLRARSIDLFLLISIIMLILQTYHIRNIIKVILSLVMVAFFSYTIYAYVDLRIKWNALVSHIESQKALYGDKAEIVYSANKFRIEYFMIGPFFKINANKDLDYFGLDYVFGVKSIEFK